MPDLDAVVNALATRVATVPTLAGRTFPFGKDFVDPPGAIVVPSTGDFWIPDDTMDGGSDEFTLVVKLLVGAQNDRTGDAQLRSYLARTGANSVYTAVYNASLGGGIDSVRLIVVRGYGEVEWANMIFYGAEQVYQVWT